jgi:hypothetical protein
MNMRSPLPKVAAATGLFAAVLAIAGVPALLAEEKLVAPAYPGAIRLSPAAVPNMVPVEFAVGDPHDKVAAFYAPKFGRVAAAGETERSAGNLTNIIILSEPQVMKFIALVKGDYTVSRPAIVSIEWVPEVLAPMSTVNGVFRELESQARRFKVHQGELPELKKKYAFLQTAYYLSGKEQEILLRCGRESGSVGQSTSDPKAMKAYSDEVKKLTQEGRYSEMAELQKKYFGDMAEADKRSRADNFAVWRKALDDLAAVGYQTKLKIDTHPSQWDFSWEKKKR